MAGWDGAGNFVLPYSMVAEAAAGVKILSSHQDTQWTAIQAGLQNCQTRDGQNSPSADISWANHKLTNLLAPTNQTDAANKQYADFPTGCASWSKVVTPLSVNNWHRIGSFFIDNTGQFVRLSITTDIGGGIHFFTVDLSKTTTTTGTGVVCEVALRGIFGSTKGTALVRFVDAGINNTTSIDIQFKSTDTYTVYCIARSYDLSSLIPIFVPDLNLTDQGTGAAGTSLDPNQLFQAADISNGVTFTRTGAGAVRSNAFDAPVRTVTANTVLGATDSFVICNLPAGITITLPAANISGTGFSRRITLFPVGATIITVAVPAGNSLNGTLNGTRNSGFMNKVMSDGNLGWWSEF